MSYTVVTSMSHEIAGGYGLDFLRTWDQHWPGNVRLVLYLDADWAPYDPLWNGRDVRSTDEVRGLFNWLEMIAPFPLMRGDVGEGKYDIQFDARQARKVFIQAHACEQFGGKVAWIDADVITHAPVPADFLDRVLPDGKLNAYLGRDPWFYTETGFLAWNADHPGCANFMKAWRNVYLSGAIFTQKGWHDCYGFDRLRRQLPAKFFLNLAEGLPDGTMHPFINSPLGAFMDHRKGNRKKTRSTKADLVVERTEPYWLFDIGDV